jgi:hypothetical protein
MARTDVKKSDRNRYQVSSEVPTTESYFLREACHLHFSILQTKQRLHSLAERKVSIDTKQKTLFNSHKLKSQQLSDQVEKELRLFKVKLDELQSMAKNDPCFQAVPEILQYRMMSLTKDYAKCLEQRKKSMIAVEEKRIEFSFTNGMTPGSLAEPSFLEQYDHT